MFDLLGWRWVYEPENLYGWLPDFLIFGHRRSMYVEIKPHAGNAVSRLKIERAVEASGFCIKALLLGESPRLEESKLDLGGVAIGDLYARLEEWYDEDDGLQITTWFPAILMLRRSESHPLPFDLYAMGGFDTCLMAGGNETSKSVCRAELAETHDLWNQAGSMVRYRAGERSAAKRRNARRNVGTEGR